MWWMLWMLVKSTHQVVVCLPHDIAHWPPAALRSVLRPSTTLLTSNLSFMPHVYGYCWYAGFLRATLTVNKHTSNSYITYLYRTHLRWYNLYLHFINTSHKEVIKLFYFSIGSPLSFFTQSNKNFFCIIVNLKRSIHTLNTD